MFCQKLLKSLHVRVSKNLCLPSSFPEKSSHMRTLNNHTACAKLWGKTLHHNFPSQTQAEEFSNSFLSSPKEALRLYKCLWAFFKSLSVFIFLLEEEAVVFSSLKYKARRSKNPGSSCRSYTASTKDFKHLCVFVGESVFKSSDNAGQTWAKYLFTPNRGCISVLGRDVWLAAQATTEAALSMLNKVYSVQCVSPSTPVKHFCACCWKKSCRPTCGTC